MNNNKWFRSARLPLLAVFAVLTAVLLSTISLVQPTTAQEIVLPTVPPDAAAGLAIYDQRCIVCHGELGDGQGAQALEAGFQPTAFSN
ncbi:hypothetical protein MNBD_CHLOROFLEXI01-3425, partial [hydrothermal vent metagenome]